MQMLLTDRNELKNGRLGEKAPEIGPVNCEPWEHRAVNSSKFENCRLLDNHTSPATPATGRGENNQCSSPDKF